MGLEGVEGGAFVGVVDDGVVGQASIDERYLSANAPPQQLLL